QPMGPAFARERRERATARHAARRRRAPSHQSRICLIRPETRRISHDWTRRAEVRDADRARVRRYLVGAVATAAGDEGRPPGYLFRAAILGAAGNEHADR